MQADLTSKNKDEFEKTDRSNDSFNQRPNKDKFTYRPRDKDMQFIEPVGTDSDIEVGGVDRDIKFIVASDVDRESELNEPNGGTGSTSSWTGEHRVHCGQIKTHSNPNIKTQSNIGTIIDNLKTDTKRQRQIRTQTNSDTDMQADLTSKDKDKFEKTDEFNDKFNYRPNKDKFQYRQRDKDEF